MNSQINHTFHIPVMGLAYTVDTPIKVARFGITSVVSIIQDRLLEQMREFYCREYGEEFTAIDKQDIDHRAKRITAYLNLMQRIVKGQIEKMKSEGFDKNADLVKYFELLPEDSEVKHLYLKMKAETGINKFKLQQELIEGIIPGQIDVNIMTKLDKPNYSESKEELPVEYCDAMAAFRGFANSELSSSVVFSAGLNPRLYSYIETFHDFFPDAAGNIKKKIILKVSDYRSAMIQGKFLAKKGIWISEFRIESGLNCGGHAFPTEGRLLGPILEEFKTNKNQLKSELFDISSRALSEKKLPLFESVPDLKFTVQGGIGTFGEDKFLREYYDMDGTGWGSPFLLVPEATNVDEKTLNSLAGASKEDYYLSYASPLGIPFNNFRKSSAELQRMERINKNKAGSPCHLKHLVSNNEFTKDYICLASRDYQRRKIKSIEKSELEGDSLSEAINSITEKDCLCTGLSASVLLKNNLEVPFNLKAVTICPGPNLAYFSNIFSLDQMVGHIYGRLNILNQLSRSHMFVNELVMYVDLLKKELKTNILQTGNNKRKYFDSFRQNLNEGIDYYRSLITDFRTESDEFRLKFLNDIEAESQKIRRLFSQDEIALLPLN